MTSGSAVRSFIAMYHCEFRNGVIHQSLHWRNSDARHGHYSKPQYVFTTYKTGKHLVLIAKTVTKPSVLR